MQLHAEQAPELPAWEPVFVWPGKRAVPPGIERWAWSGRCVLPRSRT
jgi:hypothetical protein